MRKFLSVLAETLNPEKGEIGSSVVICLTGTDQEDFTLGADMLFQIQSSRHRQPCFEQGCRCRLSQGQWECLHRVAGSRLRWEAPTSAGPRAANRVPSMA